MERAGYVFLLDGDDGPFEIHFCQEGVDIAELQDVFVKDGDERNEITFQVKLAICSDDLKPQDNWRRSKSEDSNLGEDLLKFFVEAPSSDLTIVVGEGQGQKSFKAHKGFLMARSEYFRAFVESEMRDSRENTVRVV